MKILHHTTTIVVLLFFIVVSFFLLNKKQQEIKIDWSKSINIAFPTTGDDLYFKNFMKSNVALDTIKLTTNYEENKDVFTQLTLKIQQLENEDNHQKCLYITLLDEMPFKYYLHLFLLYKKVNIKASFVSIKNEVWIIKRLENYDPPSWQEFKDLELLPYE